MGVNRILPCGCARSYRDAGGRGSTTVARGLRHDFRLRILNRHFRFLKSTGTPIAAFVCGVRPRPSCAVTGRGSPASPSPKCPPPTSRCRKRRRKQFCVRDRGVRAESVLILTRRLDGREQIVQGLSGSKPDQSKTDQAVTPPHATAKTERACLASGPCPGRPDSVRMPLRGM